MNISTTVSATQSTRSEDLSSRQRQLLEFFGAMTESAQEFLVGMAEHNARVFPRQRPKLSLVTGAAA